MKIARQGLPFVLGGIAVAAVGGFLLNVIGWLLVFLGIGFAAFCSYFFRDPERELPTDEGKIWSPGDGRVLSVAKEGPGELTTIRIFLSIFDVHIQRAPCSGTVDKIQYVPGSFAATMKDEAKGNERNIVRIVNPKGIISVEQIAGLVARRIECWALVGQGLKAGERYGLIRFGSQAAVHLPAGAKALVSAGDRCVGGVTAIAAWTKAS